MNNPFILFEDWFAAATKAEPNDPDAMCLATVNTSGQPSTRMVLLKGYDDRGFVFYTNSHSQKAQDIATNPHVSLCFHWKSLRKQVRIVGQCTPVSATEADAYFASRGRESRLGAWASDQSAILDTRETFLAKIASVTAEFAGKDVPRPPHWGGYRVVPTHLEFWEDRPHRLHDRIVFTRTTPTEPWQTHKLYP
jgi:pyridoxamine 5'-phosphate oxidase